MKCNLIFTLLAALISSSLAAPFGLSDIFPGLLQNANVEQAPEQDVVKRQVLANPDGELKQISFQTLIGDLENSLFQSALSLNGASAPDSEVDEIKPDQQDQLDHSISKRADEVVAAPELTATPEDAQERKILVQTTKKVPVSDESGPAHLIIDRVSVQPHNGLSVPLIPTFQVHRTKITSATILEDANNDASDGKQTKISITKTSITSTAPVESVETQSTSIKPEVTSTEQGTSSHHSEKEGNSSTTISISTSTTSELPIEKLKQVEEKLKEKVAEVEAEPVILTARV